MRMGMILGIIHYVGAVFCYSFLGRGPFFLSSLSRDGDDDDNDEWETYCHYEVTVPCCDTPPRR